MADFLDMKIHAARWGEALQSFDVDSHKIFLSSALGMLISITFPARFCTRGSGKMLLQLTVSCRNSSLRKIFLDGNWLSGSADQASSRWRGGIRSQSYRK